MPDISFLFLLEMALFAVFLVMCTLRVLDAIPRFSSRDIAARAKAREDEIHRSEHEVFVAK
jgi:cytochrome c biogenesis protein ResB